MKRAGVVSEASLDPPRRSKRLANTKNASVALPSVVSIGSNEGPSNNTNNAVNSTKPPPVHVFFRDFPQDAIQQVNAMLPIFTEHMDDAANDSDDSDDDDTNTHAQQLQYIQMKECIFRICKFALLENSFLGKDDETRQVQATAMNTLVYSSSISSNENKEFELVQTFLQVIIARGNVLPPKSLHLFQQTHEELWQEIHTTVGPPHDSESTTLEERFTTFLILQGEKLVELHNSKISLANYILRHDFIKLNQTVELIQVQRAIVQLWIHLLQDESSSWNALHLMRMEQLENAHASFCFCKRVLLSVDDLKSLDVKMMLWKLVLHCSYAMDWPCDTLAMENREVLKRLKNMVRR